MAKSSSDMMANICEKPLQFWREIWIQVLVILLQLYRDSDFYNFLRFKIFQTQYFCLQNKFIKKRHLTFIMQFGLFTMRPWSDLRCLITHVSNHFIHDKIHLKIYQFCVYCSPIGKITLVCKSDFLWKHFCPFSFASKCRNQPTEPPPVWIFWSFISVKWFSEYIKNKHQLPQKLENL